MSSNHILNAQPRDVSGTRASRRQRRDSYVPAVVYGAGKDSETVTLDHDQVMHSLEREAFHSAIIDLKTEGDRSRSFSAKCRCIRTVRWCYTWISSVSKQRKRCT